MPQLGQKNQPWLETGRFSQRVHSCCCFLRHSKTFPRQLRRPDISFTAVTTRLGQLTSPNFSTYVHLQIQETEMLQRCRTRPRPGSVYCCKDKGEGRSTRRISLLLRCSVSGRPGPQPVCQLKNFCFLSVLQGWGVGGCPKISAEI